MTATNQLFIDHGLPLVFGAVFLEEMGLPFPAVPWLLAAGALSASGKFSLLAGIGVTIIACLAGDTFWFYLGRYRGNQVLGLLCRLSLEPDSCVRRTQNVFTRYGLGGLLVAKFVPGLGTVAPPLAGMYGIGVGRFLFVDAVGSLLYGACFLGFGYLFRNQIKQIVTAMARIGGSAMSLLVGLAALYVAYKYVQRRRLLRELRMARITVDELRKKLDAGENLVILDLRSRAALEEDPSLIRGAIHLSLDDLDERQHEIPRDRDVIVYCSCPNEVTSARVALRLHRKGFTRVRPLLGGIDAWREQKYPMEPRSLLMASPMGSASSGSDEATLKLVPSSLIETDQNQTAKNPEQEAT